MSTFYPTRIDRNFVFPTDDIRKMVFWGNSKIYIHQGEQEPAEIPVKDFDILF